MSQPITPSPSSSRSKNAWRQVFTTGLLLYVISVALVTLTANPNLFPTMILLGNFLVPITFVAFLYERQHLSSITLPRLALSFVLGGVLSIFGAAFLEPLLIHSAKLGFFSAFKVGLIEEFAKILAVVFVARKLRHTSQLDGLLLGAAVGMGFAALESCGYAFTTFLEAFAQGLKPNAPETFPLLATVAVTALRSLLAPFGHGVWTAILAAVLFRDSKPRHFRLTFGVFITYLTVAFLHGLWDGSPDVVLNIPVFSFLPIGNWIVVIAGLTILTRLWKGGMHYAENR
jgi:protease PrsW